MTACAFICTNSERGAQTRACSGLKSPKILGSLEVRGRVAFGLPFIQETGLYFCGKHDFKQVVISDDHRSPHLAPESDVLKV